MRTRAGRGAALVAVLAAVATGCGLSLPGDPAGQDPVGGAGPAASSVRLVVSGGLGGTREVFEVSGDTRPRGTTAAEADRVLALAADEAVRELARGRVRGAAPCCDLRRYELTVRYADGSRARLVAYQTRPAPPELRRLVALLTAAR